MAVQFWQGRGRPARRRFLAFRGGYHGDTLGAMALCDPERGMHRLMRGVVANHLFADRPPGGFTADLDDGWSARTEALVAAHADELAAIVVEPVVQGAGGMHFYAPAYVEFLRGLADRHALLLILDEIATGFGRTGAFFAADHADVAPDIMCVGKALTGGYLTLAATLCTADVAEAVTSSPAGALMHGPTFMGNPLACAAALASLDVLEEGHWRHDVQRIQAGLTDGLAAAATLPEVVDVRALGAIGVIQLAEPIDVPAATAAAVAHGVWLRPFADLVYTMPPYIATDDEVRAIASAAVLAAIAGARGSQSPAQAAGARRRGRR
jgi:adenosylmethionine-8-amino-7-oxononanoate aminotransferase